MPVTIEGTVYYAFPAAVVVDRNSKLVPNTIAAVLASPTGAPLTVRDMTGAVSGLMTNEEGMLPGFFAPQLAPVTIDMGSARLPLASLEVGTLILDVEASKTAAENAAASAASSAAAAAATGTIAFQPDTPYAAGQSVLNPSGELVKRLVAGTSGAAYNAADWTPPAGDKGSALRAKLDTVYLGGRSDALFLSANDGVDQTANINAFLADPALSGRRRLVGYAAVSDTVTAPAGVWLDAEQATIKQTGSGKKAVTLAQGARMIGGTILGKMTDYVAKVGSSTPQAVGVFLNGANAHVEDVEVLGVADAGIYAINAAGARVYGTRVYGVHGREGIVIPSGDAGCFGYYFNGGCPDIDVRDVKVEEVSMGLIGSFDTTRASIVGFRPRFIRGQHGLYWQNGTGLVIDDLAGSDIELMLAKVQLPPTVAQDGLGMTVRNVVGRNVKDTVFLCNCPAADLAAAPKFRGASIHGITGHNSQRVLYASSIFGGQIGQVTGYDSGGDVLTVLDCQDVEGGGITSRNSGKAVVRFSNAAALSTVGSATQRVTLRGIRGHNPGGSGLVDDVYGVIVAGTGTGSTDGRDITLDGLDITADNGLMRSAVLVGASANQETFRLRNATQSGFTVAPYQLASASRPVGEWSNVDGNGANVANFPTTLPTRIGSIGSRSRFACAALPVSGVFQQGDVIEHTSPVASGTPGWKAIGGGGAHGGSWVASTAYTLGQWRRTSTGKVFEVVVAGTSDAATEPTATVIGTVVVDGTAQWVYRSAVLATLKALPSIVA